MKNKKITGKLVLNKKTVAHLGDSDMAVIFGGDSDGTVCATYCFCQSLTTYCFTVCATNCKTICQIEPLEPTTKP